MISAVFALAVLAAAVDPATPAPAGATAAAPAKSTAAKADKTGLVCKKEAVLGSRMKQRTCMPQADWDRLKNDARDEVEKNQSTKPLTF